jgi:hypothetical protein
MFIQRSNRKTSVVEYIYIYIDPTLLIFSQEKTGPVIIIIQLKLVLLSLTKLETN